MIQRVVWAEAIQYKKDNDEAVCDAVESRIPGTISGDIDARSVDLGDTVLPLADGDWIVMNCKTDTFEVLDDDTFQAWFTPIVDLEPLRIPKLNLDRKENPLNETEVSVFVYGDGMYHEQSLWGEAVPSPKAPPTAAEGTVKVVSIELEDGEFTYGNKRYCLQSLPFDDTEEEEEAGDTCLCAPIFYKDFL